MVLRNKKPSHFRHNRWIVLFTILWENLRILWLYYDNIGNNSDNIVFHFSTYTIWLWYILTVYCPNLIENLTYCNNSWLTYMIIILTQQYWDNIFNMLWWYYPNMVNLHNMIMTYVNRIYCPTWICDNTWLTYMMTILQNWRNDGLFWRYMLAMLSQIVMFACALLHASFCFEIWDVRGGGGCGLGKICFKLRYCSSILEFVTFCRTENQCRYDIHKISASEFYVAGTCLVALRPDVVSTSVCPMGRIKIKLRLAHLFIIYCFLS